MNKHAFFLLLLSLGSSTAIAHESEHRPFEHEPTHTDQHQHTQHDQEWRLVPAQGTYTVTTHSNYRMGPSTEFGVLGILTKDSVVEVAGKVQNRNWFLLKKDNLGFGYIHGSLIRRQQHSINNASTINDTTINSPNANGTAPALNNGTIGTDTLVSEQQQSASANCELVIRSVKDPDGGDHLIPLRFCQASDSIAGVTWEVTK